MNNTMDDGYTGYNVYDSSMESILVAKVQRLTNDGSNLGPGQYNVDQSSKAVATSPRGVVKWENNKSRRNEHFVKNHTLKHVGPGSYQHSKSALGKIMNPTIPRADFYTRTSVGPRPKKINSGGKGSINDNFMGD